MGLGITAIFVVIALWLMYEGLKEKTGGCLSFLIVVFLVAVLILRFLF